MTTLARRAALLLFACLACACGHASAATTTAAEDATVADTQTADAVDAATVDAAPAEVSGTDAADSADTAVSPDDPLVATDYCYDTAPIVVTSGKDALGADAVTLHTPHYELVAEAPLEDASAMARVLEAAYPAYKKFFGAEPTFAKNALLVVKIYANQANWQAGMKADGLTAPEAGGYYSPTNSVAYLFRQPAVYANDLLLLHEAAHQFHYLARQVQSELPFWYVEGIAEFLSRHDWDGHCVVLGTVPLLNWTDAPADALAELQKPGYDWAATIAAGGGSDRALAWATTAFFLQGDGGSHAAAYQTLRDLLDAGKPVAASVTQALGDLKPLQPALVTFLQGTQQPMQPIFAEWWHLGPHAVAAQSPGVFTAAIVKTQTSHFEAQFPIPTAAKWQIGVVIAWQDAQHFQSVLLAQDGAVTTFNSTDAGVAWDAAGQAPATSGNGKGALAVDFAQNGTATATVNGTALSQKLQFAPRAGLALYDGQAVFEKLAWK